MNNETNCNHRWSVALADTLYLSRDIEPPDMFGTGRQFPCIIEPITEKVTIQVCLECGEKRRAC